MNIIIGLGNPGKKFEQTRHNVGFIAVDEFAKTNNFPEFELNKKFNAFLSESSDILLVKPQTFMNESGSAVKKLLSKNKGRISSIIIIHDDIDLQMGIIKIVKDRGSAGHKGVESIIQNIGNDGLIRIRIGIAPAENIEAKKIVLKKFSTQEQKLVNHAIQKTVTALETFITSGLEKTMNEYNH